jgi:hypothetical protein
MGLDITVHTKIEPAVPPMMEDDPTEIDWDAAYENGIVHVFAYNGFEQSLGGLTNETWVRSVGDEWSFRAGSYGGYSDFRDLLCTTVLGVSPNEVWTNAEEYRYKPFYEIINFADNEGTIGPIACYDLSVDFAMHREMVADAVAAMRDGDYFMEKYDEWTRAFADTAMTGLVQFH